jgi:hypothetical protein
MAEPSRFCVGGIQESVAEPDVVPGALDVPGAVDVVPGAVDVVPGALTVEVLAVAETGDTTVPLQPAANNMTAASAANRGKNNKLFFVRMAGLDRRRPARAICR